MKGWVGVEGVDRLLLFIICFLFLLLFLLQHRVPDKVSACRNVRISRVTRYWVEAAETKREVQLI